MGCMRRWSPKISWRYDESVESIVAVLLICVCAAEAAKRLLSSLIL